MNLPDPITIISYELKGNRIELIHDAVFGYVLLTDDVILCGQSFWEASEKFDDAIRELNPILPSSQATLTGILPVAETGETLH